MLSERYINDKVDRQHAKQALHPPSDTPLKTSEHFSIRPDSRQRCFLHIDITCTKTRRTSNRFANGRSILKTSAPASKSNFRSRPLRDAAHKCSTGCVKHLTRLVRMSAAIAFPDAGAGLSILSCLQGRTVNRGMPSPRWIFPFSRYPIDSRISQLLGKYSQIAKLSNGGEASFCHPGIKSTPKNSASQPGTKRPGSPIANAGRSLSKKALSENMHLSAHSPRDISRPRRSAINGTLPALWARIESRMEPNRSLPAPNSDNAPWSMPLSTAITRARRATCVFVITTHRRTPMIRPPTS